jgi:hypothetical protein
MSQFAESKMIREFMASNPQFAKVVWNGDFVKVFYHEGDPPSLGWTAVELPKRQGAAVWKLEEDLYARRTIREATKSVSKQ